MWVPAWLPSVKLPAELAVQDVLESEASEEQICRGRCLQVHIIPQILKGKLAIFMGAGVSMGAGLPNWGDLLKNRGFIEIKMVAVGCFVMNSMCSLLFSSFSDMFTANHCCSVVSTFSASYCKSRCLRKYLRFQTL